MKINYASISECGKRSKNEDTWSTVEFKDENRWMGIVCDGLGGHAMGETASASVAKSITEFYRQNREGEIIEVIEHACHFASDNLKQLADSLNHVNMGTTLVMACIANNQITIAHIGDSRCYLVRKDGEVIYQTADHIKLSFGWEVLSRCFFTYDEVKAVPEIAQFEIESGDRILLCSDGLYKSMAPEILTARMADDKSPEEILDVFAFLCERNGDDNYTGIFISID